MDRPVIERSAGAHPPPQPKRRRPASSAARRGKLVSLLLIEPRPLVRECFTLWLQTGAWEVAVLAAADPAEVLENGAPAGGVDLVVFNIAGADVADERVAGTISRLRRLLPDAPVALLSDREDAEQVVAAMRHGVRGYVPTSLPLSVAIKALQLVRAGGTFVPASALGQPAPAQPPNGAPAERDADPASNDAAAPACLGGFTAREREVLARLCEGKPNKIIAHELDIRDSTVKVHVRHIMGKLRASNRTQVACLARKLFEGRAVA